MLRPLGWCCLGKVVLLKMVVLLAEMAPKSTASECLEVYLPVFA